MGLTGVMTTPHTASAIRILLAVVEPQAATNFLLPCPTAQPSRAGTIATPRDESSMLSSHGRHPDKNLANPSRTVSSRLLICQLRECDRKSPLRDLLNAPSRQYCSIACARMPCPAAREPLLCGRPMMPAQDPQPPERGGHCGLPGRPGTSAASVPASVPLRPDSSALHILAGTSATSVPPFRARSLTPSSRSAASPSAAGLCTRTLYRTRSATGASQSEGQVEIHPFLVFSRTPLSSRVATVSPPYPPP